MKSDYGVSAMSSGTKMQISPEEYTLRCKKAWGELPELSDEQFNEYIKEIRIKTGKP
jgi:hypothetical protein